jgi:hypothetical protein
MTFAADRRIGTCRHLELTRALAERHGVAEPIPIGLSVKVAAALDCMALAVSYWISVDGETDLADLLREGFAALSGEDTGASG